MQKMKSQISYNGQGPIGLLGVSHGVPWATLGPHGPLGSPWGLQGLHMREDAVSPWAGPGQPKRSKNEHKSEKGCDTEGSKTRFWRTTISGTLFSGFWLRLARPERFVILASTWASCIFLHILFFCFLDSSQHLLGHPKRRQK